jgi:arylsulfatase A-like enzyme
MFFRCLIGLTITFLVLCGLGCGEDIPSGSTGSEALPHIVFITLDTLNPAYLGCYGDNVTKTPVMDRFSQMGTLFTECHTAINLTTPSHATMLTGSLPFELGIHANALPSPDEVETVAEVLLDAGYTTMAAVSSFQLNPRNSNLGQGFQTFFTCEEPEIDGAITMKRALGWLTTHTGKPFFAWIHLFDSHAPYRPRSPYRAWYLDNEKHIRPGRVKQGLLNQSSKSESLLDTKPFLKREPFSRWYRNWLGNTSDPSYAVNHYRGTLSELDRYLEELFVQLSETHLLNQTVVVITSDHGESMGEHGIYYDHWGPYEPSVDVPLIVTGNNLPGGVVRTMLTGTIDVPPTLLQFAHCRIPDTYRGKALQPVIYGSKKSVRNHLIIEHALQAAVTIRDNRSKLIIPLEDQDFYPDREELYMIDSDLAESRNVAGPFPDQAARLRDFLKPYIDTPLMMPNVLPKQTRSRNTKEKLKALGYVH